MAVYGGEPKIHHKHIVDGVTTNCGSMSDKQKKLFYIIHTNTHTHTHIFAHKKQQK
jgi:hypothetical protein